MFSCARAHTVRHGVEPREHSPHELVPVKSRTGALGRVPSACASRARAAPSLGRAAAAAAATVAAPRARPPSVPARGGGGDRAREWGRVRRGHPKHVSRLQTMARRAASRMCTTKHNTRVQTGRGARAQPIASRSRRAWRPPQRRAGGAGAAADQCLVSSGAACTSAAAAAATPAAPPSTAWCSCASAAELPCAASAAAAAPAPPTSAATATAAWW